MLHYGTWYTNQRQPLVTIRLIMVETVYHCYSATLLHCYSATLLHCYTATLLHCYTATQWISFAMRYGRDRVAV